MHKDDANKGRGSGWCKHTRNSARGKAGHNRTVRRKVRKFINEESDNVSHARGPVNK